MLSPPAVVLHPYSLPVYPPAPQCYSGLVQGSPDAAVPPADAMTQTFPAQYPPPPPQARLPPQYHLHSTPSEYPSPTAPDHNLRIFPEQGTAAPEPLSLPPPPPAQPEEVPAPELSPEAEETESTENKSQPKRLHVSNIPFRFRDPDLRQMFGQFGKILDVEIIFNERGSKGFGFVTFENSQDADRAREKLNSSIVEGRKIELPWHIVGLYEGAVEPPFIILFEQHRLLLQFQPMAVYSIQMVYMVLTSTYGRVYTTADPYHHTVTPAYGVGAMVSYYINGLACTEEDAIDLLRTEGPRAGAEKLGGACELMAQMVGPGAENLF
ncbi:hypothetical protein JD844_001768, partial [Phrynosoma platyrhinos]